MEALTPVNNPKVKENSSAPAESSQHVAIRTRRFVKLKPRKQVKDKVERTQVVIAETPPPAKQGLQEIKEATHKQAASKQVLQRITRSQTKKSKGKIVA